jgi:hypothetical protein
MEIRPEKGLGVFLIGTSIWNVLRFLILPNQGIGKCVTRYNAFDPMSTHIILDLEALGMFSYGRRAIFIC